MTASELPNATTEGPLRLSIGLRALTIDLAPGALRVYSEKGQLLDPEAADVLLSLGGAVPAWLPAIDGLHAAYRHHGARRAVLADAANALGRPDHEIALFAKTTTDPVALTALAGAGHPQVAANPYCTATDWDLLVAARSFEVAEQAREFGMILPPSLADHPDADVRTRVARNPVCPPATLHRLAHDSESAVRIAVAHNKFADPKTLATLANRLNFVQELVTALADNPATPIESLTLLARNKHPIVRATVAANRSLPARRATRMLWDRHASIRLSLAARSDLSPLALSWIRRYSSRRDRSFYPQTLWRLANNPTSSAVLLRRVNREQHDLSVNPKRLDEQLNIRFWSTPRAVFYLYLPILLVGILINVFIRVSHVPFGVVAPGLCGAAGTIVLQLLIVRSIQRKRKQAQQIS